MKRVKASFDDGRADLGAEPPEVGSPGGEDTPSPSGAGAGVFGERAMESVRGLLYLGRIEQEFFFGGHTFLMRTLTQGEHMESAQLASRYSGTPAEQDALRCAIVAASLQEVDGSPLCPPLGRSDNELHMKFDTVKSWYPGVVAALYRNVSSLEKAASEAVAAIKKL